MSADSDEQFLTVVKMAIGTSLSNHIIQESFCKTKARNARSPANKQKFTELAEKYTTLVYMSSMVYDLVDKQLQSASGDKLTIGKPKIAENTKPLVIPKQISGVEIPRQYLCPITTDIMTDPVLCTDGHVYEKTAIQKWLDTHNTSPMTKAAVCKNTIIPCFALKSLIQEFIDSVTVSS
jgi:hypothetical protein